MGNVAGFAESVPGHAPKIVRRQGDVFTIGMAGRAQEPGGAVILPEPSRAFDHPMRLVAGRTRNRPDPDGTSAGIEGGQVGRPPGGAVGFPLRMHRDPGVTFGAQFFPGVVGKIVPAVNRVADSAPHILLSPFGVRLPPFFLVTGKTDRIGPGCAHDQSGSRQGLVNGMTGPADDLALGPENQSLSFVSDCFEPFLFDSFEHGMGENDPLDLADAVLLIVAFETGIGLCREEQRRSGSRFVDRVAPEAKILLFADLRDVHPFLPGILGRFGLVCRVASRAENLGTDLPPAECPTSLPGPGMEDMAG